MLAQPASKVPGLDPFGSAGAPSLASVPQILNVLRPDQRVVAGLADTLVTHPVTVQGLGGMTPVIGNLGVSLTGSNNLVTVECPATGNRVVLAGNRFVNLGGISGSQSTGTTGTVVVTCPNAGSATVNLDGNSFINQGSAKPAQ